MNNSFRMEWKIDESDACKTIKQFLTEQSISRTALTDIKFKGGFILINGVEATVRYILKKGDLLTIIFPKEEVSSSLKAEFFPLSIEYEDEYVLVLNKPPFMNTIPSREHPGGSLANGLMGYYKSIGIHASPHIVTRLDRNTSGLLLIAKYRHLHHLLSADQQKGRVNREYEAFVEGVMTKQSGIIDAPIGRKPESIIERMVLPEGQSARTHYKLIRQYEDFAHVSLKLETGRTHQIRVHMSHIGHPLLGDDLYGGSLSKINRQALHCKSLKFYHPVYKTIMTFVADLYNDMQNVLKIEN